MLPFPPKETGIKVPPKQQQNLRLSASSVDLLDKATGKGSVSEYFEKVITQRWQQWTAALNQLRELGWRDNEILAACHMLNGQQTVPLRSPTATANVLKGTDALLQRFGLTSKRWAERLKGLDWPTVHALTVFASEYWTGNAACVSSLVS